MSSAIEIRNISKKFKSDGKSFYALKNVSLNIEQGEIFALVGPNGSGKTTLMNIITGVLIPESGYVKIMGTDVQKDRSIVERISLVSSGTRFHWALNTGDVLNFFGRAYGIEPSEREKRIKHLTKFFDLRKILDRRFDALSTGERVRLVFAKSLLNEPQVLLMDEPTLGLDPDMALRLRAEIKRINKKFGTTIFLASHYMKEIENLSGRVAFSYKGEIKKIDKTKNMGDIEKYFIRTLKKLEAEE